MTLLVTCSGFSNTGRLTTQAAQCLLTRATGRITWVQAQKSPEELTGLAGNADDLIILNGCMDCCATKKVRAAGVTFGTEIVITDLGIKKNGMAEVRFEEIGIVAGAVIGILQRKGGEMNNEG
ncbi:MAG: putative zinc-binding protein [Methanoregulaceae archaeon]|jgi:uncharacterized metal-binding protein|nr:putative zinc-binding protein [Methanoregulaceae archaeon]